MASLPSLLLKRRRSLFFCSSVKSIIFHSQSWLQSRLQLEPTIVQIWLRNADSCLKCYGKRNRTIKCREAKQIWVSVFCTTTWLNRGCPYALTRLMFQLFFISLWPFICTLRIHEVSGSEANSLNYITIHFSLDIKYFQKYVTQVTSEIRDYCERESWNWERIPYCLRIKYRARSWEHEAFNIVSAYLLPTRGNDKALSVSHRYLRKAPGSKRVLSPWRAGKMTEQDSPNWGSKHGV
jgi:hypothetical protein